MMRRRSANKVLPERPGLGASARAGPGSPMQWRRVGQRDVDRSKEPCCGLSRRTRAATWRSLEFLNWSLLNSDAVDLAATHEAHLSCHHRDNDSMAARSYTAITRYAPSALPRFCHILVSCRYCIVQLSPSDTSHCESTSLGSLPPSS